MEMKKIEMVICINIGPNTETEFQAFLDKQDNDGWRLLNACYRPDLKYGYNEYRLNYERKFPIE